MNTELPVREKLLLFNSVSNNMEWVLWNDRRMVSAQMMVDSEELLLNDVAMGLAPPTIRVWTNQNCLVVTQKEIRSPAFSEACGHFVNSGWPVVTRYTGGTVVPHTPGILHLTLAYVASVREEMCFDRVYQQLYLPLTSSMERLGISAGFGTVEGAFCDGRFNLVVNRRKIAGAAQRRKAVYDKKGNKRTAILAHVMFLLDVEMACCIEQVNSFYRAIGTIKTIDANRSITLRECLAKTGKDDDLSREAVINFRTILLEEVYANFSIQDHYGTQKTEEAILEK